MLGRKCELVIHGLFGLIKSLSHIADNSWPKASSTQSAPVPMQLSLGTAMSRRTLSPSRMIRTTMEHVWQTNLNMALRTPHGRDRKLWEKCLQLAPKVSALIIIEVATVLSGKLDATLAPP
jgi:hypothetical protein